MFPPLPWIVIPLPMVSVPPDSARYDVPLNWLAIETVPVPLSDWVPENRSAWEESPPKYSVPFSVRSLTTVVMATGPVASSTVPAAMVTPSRVPFG